MSSTANSIKRYRAKCFMSSTYRMSDSTCNSICLLELSSHSLRSNSVHLNHAQYFRHNKYVSCWLFFWQRQSNRLTTSRLVLYSLSYISPSRPWPFRSKFMKFLYNEFLTTNLLIFYCLFFSSNTNCLTWDCTNLPSLFSEIFFI